MRSSKKESCSDYSIAQDSMRIKTPNLPFGGIQIAIGMFLLSLLVGCAETRQLPSEPIVMEVPQTGANLILALSKGDSERVSKFFIPNILEDMSPNEIQQFWDIIVAENGEFIEIKKIQGDSQPGLIAIVFVRTVFERNEVVFMISIEPEGRVSGFAVLDQDGVVVNSIS